MANKEPGYVYIFTNDSFRDGWVKIGKTQNIKKRLRDLDNTSCPLPFKVYATMKTCKYNEAEELVQDFIAHFNSDLRIRPNREYFKVAPEEALKIFYQVQKVIDDAEIEVFDTNEPNKECKKAKKAKPKKKDEEFGLIPCFINRNCEAKGLFNPEKEEILILKGSKINPNHLPNLKGGPLANREELIAAHAIEDNGALVLKDDVLFTSPSGAAKFCVGGAADGWLSWVDSEGKTISVYRNK